MVFADRRTDGQNLPLVPWSPGFPTHTILPGTKLSGSELVGSHPEAKCSSWSSFLWLSQLCSFGFIAGIFKCSCKNLDFRILQRSQIGLYWVVGQYSWLLSRWNSFTQGRWLVSNWHTEALLLSLQHGGQCHYQVYVSLHQGSSTPELLAFGVR